MIITCPAALPEEVYSDWKIVDYVAEMETYISFEVTPMAKQLLGVFRTIPSEHYFVIVIEQVLQVAPVNRMCEIICNLPVAIIIKNSSANRILDAIKKINDMWMWDQLALKVEYSYYKFSKRNWPVKKENNIDWQTVAQRIGLVSKIYCGEVKRAARTSTVQTRDRIRIAAVSTTEAKQEIRDTQDAQDTQDTQDVKREVNSGDTTQTASRVKAQVLNAGDIINQEDINQEDLDAEDMCDDLLTILQDKKRQAKREEMLLRLKSESNYAAYSIPLLTTVQPGHLVLTETSVVVIYDALIRLGRTQDAIMLICNLLISRTYYHLIIKNTAMLEKMRALLSNHPRIDTIIKYVMKYCFLLMLKEERLLGHRITSNNRSIMDEDMFRALPIFQCDADESPYVSEIYRADDTRHMRLDIIMYVPGKREFTPREVFLHRLDTMAGGMLRGIDLSQCKAFLTGSSLVPCIVTNPLENSSFKKFIDRFYPGYSSISHARAELDAARDAVLTHLDDDICKHSSSASDVSDQGDIGKYASMPDDQFMESLETIVSNNVAAARAVPKNFTEAHASVILAYDNFTALESKLSDLDIGIEASTRAQYERVVKFIFERIKINLNINEDSTNAIYLHKHPLKWGFKYVLKGTAVARPIDFFHVRVPVHVLMFKFHLNIVKFWWDGRIVRGLGSGVSAALTGINQWYRWFSNNKDPMSIVLKNMERGYTTLLNVGEIKTLQRYVNEVDQYKHLSDNLTHGKITQNHIIFASTGLGIQFKLQPIKKVDESDNYPMYWANTTAMSCIGCELGISKNGHIVQPKRYAFADMIDNLLS